VIKPAHQQFPSYLPFYYKLYCIIRKFKRQTCVRLNERKARKSGPKDIIPDGNNEIIFPAGSIKSNPKEAINKCGVWMDEDLSVPEVEKVAAEIESVKEQLSLKGLRYTSSAGMFIDRTYTPDSEKRKLWENSWVASHSNLRPGLRVLDIGGASTAFVFYLASLGCSVKVIDNDWSCCGMIYNTNYVAKKMGWDIEALDRDISKPVPFADNSFDRVFSICTVEHLTSGVRRSMMREVARVLKPGGIAGFTIDYSPNREVLTADKGLRFGYRDKLFDEIITPSGLSLYGNNDLIDVSNDEGGFLGAFFLKK